MPTLPEGFEFECPLCRSTSFVAAPQRGALRVGSALYKCGGCHFHFSDPTRYPSSATLYQLRSAGRTPRE